MVPPHAEGDLLCPLAEEKDLLQPFVGVGEEMDLSGQQVAWKYCWEKYRWISSIFGH
jgi:hypothetical protein